MKTVQSHIINKQSGIQHTISHHIKSENYGVIFNILRKQLYTDLILAPVREVAANAVDAHVEAGKAETPIKVTLPTQLDSFLRIRDYGTGLSDEKIAELYSGYGDSGKRNSNDTIGGFGIGKFAPLAYGDSFIINSYQNGIVSSWNSYIDASNRGAMSKMGVAPTNEPNGLEIVMPVKGHDVDAFHDKAINLFAYFKTTPIIINATDSDMDTLNSIKAKKALFSNEKYKFFGDNRSVAVMGGIPYKIDSSIFVDEISPEAKTILDGGVLLNFNIGGLEIAASRETLNYSPFTKKKLAEMLNEVAKDLIKQGCDSFNNCKTLWDAKCLYREVFDYYGKLYALRRFFGNKLAFNGKIIESENFINPVTFSKDGDVKINRYNKTDGYRTFKKIKSSPTDYITANNDNIVIENDINLVSGIINRVVGLIEGDKKAKNVFIISFKDDATKKKWLDETGFDKEMVLLSSLPKETLSKYYPSTSSGSSGGAKNDKHTTKEFLFNFNTTGNSWSLKNSDYFTTTDLDVENDGGIYIIIDKFCIKDRNGNFHNPTGLISMKNKLAEIGVVMPDVIGIKVAKENEVLKNNKMISLWSWLKSEIEAVFKKNPIYTQRIANHLLGIELNNSELTDANTAKQFYAKSSLGKKNDFMIVLSNMSDVLNDHNDKTRELHSLVTKIGVDCSKFKPKYDVLNQLDGMKEKYEMAFLLLKATWMSNLNKKTINAIENYITLVNEV